MNNASGHLFLPKNKNQESPMNFFKEEAIDRNIPVNNSLLTGWVPVNKSLLTGTFMNIFLKISFVTPDTYSLAKINYRSHYSFYSPTLISVLLSPPP